MKEKNSTTNGSLILFFNNKEDEFMYEINSFNDITAVCVFKPVNKVLRAIRRFHIYSNLPGISIWLGNWKYSVRDYSKIICIASNYAYRVLTWVKRQNPKAKVINYFWDSIEISKYKVQKIEGIENWSFDEHDCQKYAIKYNPQFFTKQQNLLKQKIVYDVVFVGSDRNGVLKSRPQILSMLYVTLTNLGLTSKICLLTASKDIIPEIRISEAIDSIEYNKIMAQGRVILDVVEQGAEWMTLRPLLALSNHKKVITNNHYIKKEKYYSRDNIFILGEDSDRTLKEFITSPFKEINESTLAYYSCREWVKRFD